MHTASLEVKKYFDNEGNFVEKSSQPCEGYTNDMRKFHYNCNYSL